MTLPIDPIAQEEVRKTERRVTSERTPDWRPGLVCVHKRPDVHGHCPICGKCLDHALCNAGQEVMNRDWSTWRGRGVIMWLRNLIGIDA